MLELAKGVGTADADHATPALHGEALAGWRLAGDAPGSVFYGDAALRDAVSTSRVRGGCKLPGGGWLCQFRTHHSRLQIPRTELPNERQHCRTKGASSLQLVGTAPCA